MSNVETPPLASPDKTTKEYLKYLRGFGVWFAAGLAPLLGTMHVPLFRALIDLYPESLRFSVIPISGFLMGMTAVVVDFAAARKVGTDTVGKWFKRSTIVFVASLFLLMVVYYFAVILVTFTQPDHSTDRVAVVTGSLTVPAGRSPSCACAPNSPAQECVDGGASDAAIRACFGPNRVALATLILALLYLVVLDAFAAAVGLLLLSKRA